MIISNYDTPLSTLSPSMKPLLQQMLPGMTAADRRVATVILSDYPFSGLGSIQELSVRANVSAPSITRFVSKLGLAGYQEFQRQLIDELKAGARAPLAQRFSAGQQPQEGFLSTYVSEVEARLAAVRAAVSPEDFDALCSLIGDPSRSLYLIGGRVSHSLAHMLAITLQFFRGDVHLIPPDPELWPQYVQQMKKKDALILFDFRRYQKSLERLAIIAAQSASPQIFLVTDQWLSPIAGHATRTIALPIAVDTIWDTYAPVATLLEAAIIATARRDWDATRKRIETWDRLRANPDDPATPIIFDEKAP